jgi:hypothetical protein
LLCRSLQRRHHELQQQELGEVKLALSQVLSLHSCHVSVGPSKHVVSYEESLEEKLDDQILVTSKGQFQCEENALERSQQRVIHATKRQKRLMARLRTPSWLSLSSNALEICCYKVNSGWMFTAQAYRVVPRNSPIIQLAKDGNVRGIQELFEKKLASPYDKTSDGFTVLDVSAFNTTDFCLICQL